MKSKEKEGLKLSLLSLNQTCGVWSCIIKSYYFKLPQNVSSLILEIRKIIKVRNTNCWKKNIDE